MPFQKATKRQSKARVALIGPPGSGKTFSALQIAQGLGGRVALVDTERGSASKYSDEFNFDTMELSSFHPQRYIDAIREAETAGYDVLIIDSLSHAWIGKGGALELVDQAAKRSQSHNTFSAWRDVTPLHNAMVDAMIQVNCHLIATMRSKTEYVIEKDEKTGKNIPRKVGLAPVQRDAMEYEFDVMGDMDIDNNLIISKSRCKSLTGAVIPKPGKEVSDILKAWLSDGEAPINPQPPNPAVAKPCQTASKPTRHAPPDKPPQQPDQPASTAPGNGRENLGLTPPTPEDLCVRFEHQFAAVTDFESMNRVVDSVKRSPVFIRNDLMERMRVARAKAIEMINGVLLGPANTELWEERSMCVERWGHQLSDAEREVGITDPLYATADQLKRLILLCEEKAMKEMAMGECALAAGAATTDSKPSV